MRVIVGPVLCLAAAAPLAWGEKGEAPAEAPSPIRIEPAGGTVEHTPARPAGEEPAPLPPDTRLVAGLMIQVNNQYLTLSDVLAPLHDTLVELGRRSRTAEAFAQEAEELIRRKLRESISNALVYSRGLGRLSEDARTRLDELVTEHRKDLISRYGAGSIEQARRRLAEEGTTLEERLDQFRRHVIVRSYLRDTLSDRVAVTRPAIVRYYRQHQRRWVTPERRELLLLVFEGTGAETRDRAASAASELKAGKPFAELAEALAPAAAFRQIWLTRGSYRLEAVEKALFSLQPGEVSDVIEAEGALYVIGLGQIAPAKRTPLEEVEGEIGAGLREQIFERLSQEYLRDLFGKATITTPPDFVARAVELALRRYFHPPE